MSQNQARVPVSIARLGERIYSKTNDFILSDPCMNIMRPSYNSLHDPHLRNYYQRKDIQDHLRKKNLITKDNEVKCSLKEYRRHQKYLENLQMLCDKNVSQIQRNKMRTFLEYQEKGLIPKDLTLSDMREILLEEEVERMQQVMKSEAARDKSKDGQERHFQMQMDLMSWKIEERARLRRIEKEVQCEFNKKRHLKEAQERRENKKQATYMRKISNQQLQVFEKIRVSEESVIEERRNRPIIPPPQLTYKKKQVVSTTKNKPDYSNVRSIRGKMVVTSQNSTMLTEASTQLMLAPSQQPCNGTMQNNI